jgi:hypothetical protein
VIDRSQSTAAKELRQSVGIDMVALVSLSGLPATIADHDPIHHGHQAIVQPLRLGPFFERHVDRSAHHPQELEDRLLLRR